MARHAVRGAVGHIWLRSECLQVLWPVQLLLSSCLSDDLPRQRRSQPVPEMAGCINQKNANSHDRGDATSVPPMPRTSLLSVSSQGQTPQSVQQVDADHIAMEH